MKLLENFVFVSLIIDDASHKNVLAVSTEEMSILNLVLQSLFHELVKFLQDHVCGILKCGEVRCNLKRVFRVSIAQKGISFI